MLVDEDLVGAERDQRAAAHRVVRHHGGHLPVVVGERARDLLRGQHEPARRVQDDLDVPARRRVADRPENALRVVDVDVADERESE